MQIKFVSVERTDKAKESEIIHPRLLDVSHLCKSSQKLAHIYYIAMNDSELFKALFHNT